MNNFNKSIGDGTLINSYESMNQSFASSERSNWIGKTVSRGADENDLLLNFGRPQTQALKIKHDIIINNHLALLENQMMISNQDNNINNDDSTLKNQSMDLL